MSEALPLPPRPNLEQYKKLAKDLQSACKSNDPDAVRGWAARWAERIARLHGLKIAPQSIEQRWHESTKGTLSDAQFFLAREHGFASWPKFAEHLEALARADSPVSRFEAAADTIVAGDVAALQTLLRENPELIRARSTREHRSTLLHYVSANGVEDFRQKTPKNILEVTELLLKAGADVDAESDAYGGRSTALGLTATSWHPEKAGVQLALMELLIGHGAAIDPPDGGSAVNACLGNGRGEAAEFLANHGARLDLEGAAGVGRLDVVRNLQPLATPKQMREAFAWACQFGRTSVVDFLLQTGMDVQAKLPHHGQTGLHWAAYGGHADTVRLLLERGAPTGAKDEKFDGTALGWALYAWQRSPRAAHYEVVALLARAGADEAERRQYVDVARHDPRMLAALRAKIRQTPLLQSRLNAMFQGLEHTAIASPNPQRLAEWYVEHLGFRINFEYACNFFVRAPNGSMLEIIPAEGAVRPATLKDPGLRHLAIAVDDFDAAFAHLQRQGTNFLAEPYENQGNRLVFFTDADGNFLHLIQRPKPLP